MTCYVVITEYDQKKIGSHWKGKKYLFKLIKSIAKSTFENINTKEAKVHLLFKGYAKSFQQLRNWR